MDLSIGGALEVGVWLVTNTWHIMILIIAGPTLGTIVMAWIMEQIGELFDD